MCEKRGGIVDSGERCSACKFHQEFMVFCIFTVSKRRTLDSAIVHQPANEKVVCMLSASGTVTQAATRPYLSRAS